MRGEGEGGQEGRKCEGTHLKAPNDDKALNVKFRDVGTNLLKALLGESPSRIEWGRGGQ